MRILAFSDLHDDDYALELLKKYYDKANDTKEQGKQFDYVFITGDTTNFSINFVEDVLFSFPDCFIIPGNNEPQEVLDFFKAHKNYVHEKRVEINDNLNVVGFGYSNITPYNTLNELTEDEIYNSMTKLNIDKNTLLLTHCPPNGFYDLVRDKNIGSTSIKKIVEEKKPFAIFSGHVHEYAGVKKIGETTAVKIPAAKDYKACVVDITNKNLTVNFIALQLY